MTLADRTKAILESVIKDYIETAEPVGSRSVVKKYNLKISAATVRNEMADLEEMGYLEPVSYTHLRRRRCYNPGDNPRST